MKRVSELFADYMAMFKSMAKIAVLSRPVSLKHIAGAGKIIILGNGPSLKQTLETSSQLLRHSTCMSVNFAANTPEFFNVRPQYYIMADPHFFLRTDQPNVKLLYQNLARIDWQITLLVPRQFAKTARCLLGKNPNISIMSFNFVGLKGPAWFESFVFKHRLGMPRPRNVLIPAIMTAINLGYDDISIVGADHSWLQSIWVNDNNEVVSVQPHFYKEDKTELQRVKSEYCGYKLHDILQSFYIAFQSYHNIRRYADRHNIKITNCTPGSYIDAFGRCTLGN